MYMNKVCCAYTRVAVVSDLCWSSAGQPDTVAGQRSRMQHVNVFVR